MIDKGQVVGEEYWTWNVLIESGTTSFPILLKVVKNPDGTFGDLFIEIDGTYKSNLDDDEGLTIKEFIVELNKIKKFIRSNIKVFGSEELRKNDPKLADEKPLGVV